MAIEITNVPALELELEEDVDEAGGRDEGEEERAKACSRVEGDTANCADSSCQSDTICDSAGASSCCLRTGSSVRTAIANNAYSQQQNINNRVNE